MKLLLFFFELTSVRLFRFDKSHHALLNVLPLFPFTYAKIGNRYQSDVSVFLYPSATNVFW